MFRISNTQLKGRGLNRALMGALLMTCIGCSTTWDGEKIDGHYSRISPKKVDQTEARYKRGVGETVVTSWKMSSQEMIAVLSDVRVEARDMPYSVIMTPGLAVLEGRDNTYKYYRLLERIKIAHPDRGQSAKGGIAVPKFKGGAPVKAFWWPDKSRQYPVVATVVDSVDYRPMDNYMQPIEFDGFSQTITYLGLSGGKLNFVYREYSDRILRDAFTQEFSFDYKPGEQYRFKNAVFTVHEATHSDIDLTVSSYFE